MKNILFPLAFSILACNGIFAQDKLDGCWGLKFGMGQGTIVKIVRSQLSVIPSTISKEMIGYKDV